MQRSRCAVRAQLRRGASRGAAPSLAARARPTAASAAATKLAAVVAADESLGVAGKVARAHLTAADFPPQQQHRIDEGLLSPTDCLP